MTGPIIAGPASARSLAFAAYAAIAVALVSTSAGSQSAFAEQLPWGKTASDPEVITPSTRYDPDPLDPSENYDTSTRRSGGRNAAGGSGGYADDSYDPGTTQTRRTRGQQDRYQDDPDYSTYQPADPQRDWADDGDGLDDGLYDDAGRQRQAHRKPYDDAAPPKFDDTPQPSRFDGTFTADEIVNAGHNAFGQVARGFANVVEYAFRKKGRPNGYIIGQEAGGAIVAGLRYGEGILYTKNAGTHAVYWQGPSVGYDFGAEGSKTMILVYDMRRPSDVYGRFGGIDGSAYLVGGVGVTFQQNGHVTMAPIRSGVGLRLGANVGYLKYSRVPTWNPF